MPSSKARTKMRRSKAIMKHRKAQYQVMKPIGAQTLTPGSSGMTETPKNTAVRKRAHRAELVKGLARSDTRVQCGDDDSGNTLRDEDRHQNNEDWLGVPVHAPHSINDDTWKKNRQ